MLKTILKKLFFYLFIFAVVGIIVYFTTKRENENWKNTVILVMDTNFYNLTYINQKDDINKILDNHYTKSVELVVNMNDFRYDVFKRDLLNEIDHSNPTHIIFSPTMVVNLYANLSTDDDITKHNRGRAKLIGLSRIIRNDTLDEVYTPESISDVWTKFASLADVQTESVAFIYNNSEEYSRNAYAAFHDAMKNDIFILDEYPRNEGENECNDLYNILFNERDTKIIFTPYFKNLSRLANRLNIEKKDVLFVTDIEMTIPLTLLNNKNIGAISDFRFDEVINEALENVSFSSNKSSEVKDIKRVIYILNDRIKTPNNTMEFVR